MHLGRLSRSEWTAVAGGLLLAVAIFLPWYGTSENPNAEIDGARGDFSAWEVHPILRWLLLLAALAPLILAWIVLRDHELSWPRGELTAVVAMAALVLVLYNGIVTRPGRAALADQPADRLVPGGRGHPADDGRRRQARHRGRTKAQATGSHVMKVTPDRNLALELVRVTEAAALASARWIGRGDKEAADQAAVDGMHAVLHTIHMNGRRGDRRGREGRGADAPQRRADRRRQPARGRRRRRPARGHAPVRARACRARSP